MSARELLLAAVEDTRTRIRLRGRQAIFRALRLSGAAAASYQVAHLLSPNTVPILAPLTAILVVQVTLSSTLHSGIERVVSVVAGVLLAVIFSAMVGLTWWSLAALVAVSIIIGQLLRLGPNLVEVPISAMLVLAVGGGAAEVVATGRIYETAIGALVGVAINVLFPPAVRSLDAGARVERFAGRIARILDGAADELSAGGGTPQKWLDDARRLSRHVPDIDKEITESHESRQLNVRALGTPNTAPSLRDGLDALEHSLVAVRSLFRSVLDGARTGHAEVGDPEESGGPDGGGGDEPGEYAQDVREAFALLLRDLANCFRSYGQMVRAQVEDDAVAESQQVAQALADLREARARVAEMLLLGPREDPEYWELNVALLSTVERVLRELDVEDYARERAASLAAQEVGLKHQSHQAAERLRRRVRPRRS